MSMSMSAAAQMSLQDLYPPAGDLNREKYRCRTSTPALDLPTFWMMAKPDDAFTARIFEALNAMMLDMLAAICARKDYDDRGRPSNAGDSQGKDPWQIPRPARGQKAQCRPNEHAEARNVVELDYTVRERSFVAQLYRSSPSG